MRTRLLTASMLLFAGCAIAPDEGLTAAEAQASPCGVLVVGGSTAAFSATLSAARAGARVCLAQPTDRLGGQFTSQALPASDDGELAELPATGAHAAGESFAFSVSQRQFRVLERQQQTLGGSVVANPGRCWVSPLCTLPMTAQSALQTLLQPYLASGAVTIYSSLTPTSVRFATGSSGRAQVTGVAFRDGGGNDVSLDAGIVVEATDLGDLLEVGQIASVIGQEARATTGEAPLPEVACPLCQQSFTYDVVVQRTASGAGVPVAAPAGYGSDLAVRNYTATMWSQPAGNWQSRAFFADFSIFDYRRILAASSAGGAVGDVAVLNWGCQVQGPSGATACGNDYGGGALTGVSRDERAAQLERARARARGYVYFLQHAGAADLRVRGDLTGTPDGVAAEPYVREARRGVALHTIVHHDLAASAFPGTCSEWPATSPLAKAQCRGTAYADTIGVGQYHYFDLHANATSGGAIVSGADAVALPYTIPLGALVPRDVDGLVLSAKSIGTTHLTNAVYRMHSSEWAIGEASGAAAAWALAHGIQPRDLAGSPTRVAQLQAALADVGVPLYWFDDVTTTDRDFAAIQLVAAAQLVIGDDLGDLHFRPEEAVDRALACDALVKALGLAVPPPTTQTFTDVPPTHWAYATIEAGARAGIVHGYGDGRFGPDDPVLREQLGFMVANASPALVETAFASTPRDQAVMRKRELSRVLAVLYRDRVAK